jgi:hypothetical protein
MVKPKNQAGIQVDEDLSFQKKEWIAERTGWVILGILLVLGLIGLFGGGPISQDSISGGDGFQVTYQRFHRRLKPSDLVVNLPQQAFSEGQVSLWISWDYLEKFQIQKITPEPDRVETGVQFVTFWFFVPDPAQSVEIRFDLEPVEGGLFMGRIGWVTDKEIIISQFIFP